jgi:hypothetical protein
MATIGVNWAGVVVTLTEPETQGLQKAEDVSAAVAAMLALLPPPADLVAGAIGAYIGLNKAVLGAVDQGNGVYLTLTWPAMWFGQWWLIIPTPVPVQAAGMGAVTVRRSTGKDFGPNEDWTQIPYYGSRGSFFADVTGDGKADAIVVNDDTVTVRPSTGKDFGPNEDWTHGPYFGSRGTFFADVNGDGTADAIVVNDDTVTVRPSTGKDFGPNEDWTHGAYFGTLGTVFADVSGDGKADAIVVNIDTVTVRPSTGKDFGPNEDWTHGAFFGNRGTFFADVSGDGKADAIASNGS